MEKIGLYNALKRMRELSEANVPFSIGFLSCDLTNGVSNGYKKVDSVMLRTGFTPSQSDKHNSLIGYLDVKTGDNRWFYLPLLFEFNKMEIK